MVTYVYLSIDTDLCFHSKKRGGLQGVLGHQEPHKVYQTKGEKGGRGRGKGKGEGEEGEGEGEEGLRGSKRIYVDDLDIYILLGYCFRQPK